MISLSVRDWPIAEKRKIFTSNIYNLEVFATREKPKNYKDYNTKFDSFILTINKLDSDKSENNEVIKFSNINFLESIIKNFYKKIIAFYKKPNTPSSYECQLDISLNALNLKYLRSGIFKSNGDFEGIIKILLSQLLSAFRSDENLVIDNSFKIHLTVTNITNKFPTYKHIGSTKENLSLANKLIAKQFMATKHFFDLLKRGIVDIGQINKSYNKMNCTLLNLSFAYFLRSKNISLLNALELFSDLELSYYRKFISYFKLENIIEKQTLFHFLEDVSKKIKMPIIVISPSKKLSFNNEIIFISTNRSYIKSNLPIYLLLSKEENELHISFAHNFKIKSNSNLFCQLCSKSVAHKFHNCKHPICFLCQRYMSKFSLPFTKNICTRMTLKNIEKTCEDCHNIFQNENCFKTHIDNKLSGKKCLPYRKCLYCNIFIKHNLKKTPHICGVKFCTKCKKRHDIKGLCYITPEMNISKKNCYKDYFLNITFSSDKIPIFASVTNIQNDVAKTIFLAKNSTFLDQKDLLKNWCDGQNDTLSAEMVFNYFENLKCKSENMSIFSDPNSFDFLCDFISNENSSLYFAKNGLASFKLKFKKKLIKYRNLSSIIDSKLFELAFFCDKNMISIEIPSKFTKQSILTSQVTSLNLLDFNVQYVGSSRKMFTELVKQKAAFKEMTDKTYILFFQIANEINDIYVTSIYNLSKMFESCQKNLLTPQKVSILRFNTLSSAGNYILRSKLEQNSLPILNHKSLSIRYNTSKLEIVVAHVLSELHFITCKDRDKLYSFITRDGKQFQKKQFSADFYCENCALIYYIEGKFKIDTCYNGCKVDSQKTFFGMNKSFLSQKASKNRQKMINLCNNKSMKSIVFNQCCLEKKDLSVLKKHIENHLEKFQIPNIQLKVNYLINIFEQKKINYSQEIYERLNTSKCINPQLIEYITPIFNLEGPSDIEIRKYDMNNSYGSQLEYLRLPYKDQGTTYLFDQANNIFKDLTAMYKKGTFKFNGYGRAKILATKNKYTKILPFLGFFSLKNETSYLTLCHKCAILKTKYCSHSMKQRSFYVQSTLESFLFAKCVLNYKIYFTEIILFKNCENYKEIFNSYQSLSLLRLENKFYSNFAKRILLQGLGSFSINRENFNDIYTVSNKSALESTLSGKNLDFKSFRFIGKSTSPHCVVEKSKKCKQRNINNKSHTLLFSSVSNKARIILYEYMMKLIDKGCHILRVDSDAISFAYHNSKQNYIDNLMQNKFKIESQSIKGIVSFKKRSYIIENFDKNKSQIKVCGMSLDFNQRFNISSFQDISNKLRLKQKSENKKTITRIWDENMTYAQNGVNFLKSHPFGSLSVD